MSEILCLFTVNFAGLNYRKRYSSIVRLCKVKQKTSLRLSIIATFFTNYKSFY